MKQRFRFRSRAFDAAEFVAALRQTGSRRILHTPFTCDLQTVETCLLDPGHFAIETHGEEFGARIEKFFHQTPLEGMMDSPHHTRMADRFMQLVLTPTVQRAQDKYFGRHQTVDHAPDTDALTSEEAGFIASRDSFYMASVTETGWPYVQHRGGPVGFVKVLGPSLLGFADFKGNRQLVSTGNLDATDRVALFMMDYPSRTRLKLLGHARVLDAREHPDLVEQLAPEALRSKVERLFMIQVVSYDWNCPQYITPRFTLAEVEEYAAPLKTRIAELESRLAALANPVSDQAKVTGAG